jgi:hypothetical protein
MTKAQTEETTMSNMTCIYAKVILGETHMTSLSAGKSAEVGEGCVKHNSCREFGCSGARQRYGDVTQRSEVQASFVCDDLSFRCCSVTLRTLGFCFLSYHTTFSFFNLYVFFSEIHFLLLHLIPFTLHCTTRIHFVCFFPFLLRRAPATQALCFSLIDMNRKNANLLFLVRI